MATYEKGKGDAYQLHNMESSEAVQFLDKKKGTDISETAIDKLSQTTASLLFIFNKTKEKVEIIKLDHSKLFKCNYKEQKTGKVVYHKPEGSRTEPVEIERERVKSSITVKNGEKSMESMQKHFVENLIEIKLKSVMEKFDQLERRVMSLENVIRGINSKIEANLEKINRKEIKLKVEQMFDTLTPQFEKYFSEIFKQVSGVFEQGVNYYNLKLAKEAEFHKEALTQIVSETFKFTDEVVGISQKEQDVSEKTEDALKKILESKRRWSKEVEDFQNKAREVPSPLVRTVPQGEAGKGESKVFVRADLNYPAAKR